MARDGLPVFVRVSSPSILRLVVLVEHYWLSSVYMRHGMSLVDLRHYLFFGNLRHRQSSFWVMGKGEV